MRNNYNKNAVEAFEDPLDYATNHRVVDDSSKSRPRITDIIKKQSTTPRARPRVPAMRNNKD